MIKIKNRLLKLVILAGYCIPIVILLSFVIKFSVNVPYWDDWSLVGLYDKVAFSLDDTTFSAFWGQHNEHRLLFPKIIFVALAFLSKNNLILIIAFNIAILLLTSLLILLISWKQYLELNSNIVYFHFISITTLFIFLSLSQYENLIWAFQLPWFLINLCLIISVYLFTNKDIFSLKLKFLFSCISCCIASFSSSFGLLIWLAVFPVLLFNSSKERIKIIVGWLVCFLICFLCYTNGYEKPLTNADPLWIIKQPITGITYFLISIGSIIGISNFSSAIIGILVLIIFIFFNIQTIRKKPYVYKKNLVSWLSLGWFSIIFNILTTIGRGSYGLEQAMTSRYITPTTLLYVACIQMSFLFFIQHKDFYKTYIILFFGIVIGLLLAFSITKYENLLIKAEINKNNRIRGSICLELVNFLDTSYNESVAFHLLDKQSLNCLQAISPSPETIRVGIKIFEKLGFRQTFTNIDFIHSPEELYGDINLPHRSKVSTTIERGSNLSISGWAIIPNVQQQPQMVFFSYGEEKTFFADAFIHIPRSDVVEAFKSKNYEYSGWEASISLKSLPIGNHIIKAWVYDQQAKQFIRLGGEPKIRIV